MQGLSKNCVLVHYGSFDCKASSFIAIVVMPCLSRIEVPSFDTCIYLHSKHSWTTQGRFWYVSENKTSYCLVTNSPSVIQNN